MNFEKKVTLTEGFKDKPCCMHVTRLGNVVFISNMNITDMDLNKSKSKLITLRKFCLDRGDQKSTFYLNLHLTENKSDIISIIRLTAHRFYKSSISFKLGNCFLLSLSIFLGFFFYTCRFSSMVPMYDSPKFIQDEYAG